MHTDGHGAGKRARAETRRLHRRAQSTGGDCRCVVCVWGARAYLGTGGPHAVVAGVWGACLWHAHGWTWRGKKRARETRRRLHRRASTRPVSLHWHSHFYTKAAQHSSPHSTAALQPTPQKLLERRTQDGYGGPSDAGRGAAAGRTRHTSMGGTGRCAHGCWAPCLGWSGPPAEVNT